MAGTGRRPDDLGVPSLRPVVALITAFTLLLALPVAGADAKRAPNKPAAKQKAAKKKKRKKRKHARSASAPHADGRRVGPDRDRHRRSTATSSRSR